MFGRASSLALPGRDRAGLKTCHPSSSRPVERERRQHRVVTADRTIRQARLAMGEKPIEPELPAWKDHFSLGALNPTESKTVGPDLAPVGWRFSGGCDLGRPRDRPRTGPLLDYSSLGYAQKRWPGCVATGRRTRRTDRPAYGVDGTTDRNAMTRTHATTIFCKSATDAPRRGP